MIDPFTQRELADVACAHHNPPSGVPPLDELHKDIYLAAGGRWGVLESANARAIAQTLIDKGWHQ